MAMNQYSSIIAAEPRLAAKNITIGYDRHIIARELSVDIPSARSPWSSGPTPAASPRCRARRPAC
jgi:hypothetical protein